MIQKVVTREEAAEFALQQAINVARPGFVTRTIDRLLEPIAPARVAARIEHRQEIGFRRAMLSYSAANLPFFSFGRQVDASPLTSEEAQLPGWSRFQIIQEARDLYRNMPILRAAVDGIARRVVGTGIHPIIRTSDGAWNQEATRQWQGWTEDCETRGMFDFDGLCRQIVRSDYVDGDLGFRICIEDDDLRLQAVEGDLIAADNRIDLALDTINPIGGVILDLSTGRPLAYQVGRRGVGGLLIESEMVAAESFLLLFRAQRVDQVRGVPLLAPVIQTARDLDRYVTATRVQANIAATYGVVIKRNGAGQIQQMQTKVPPNQNLTAGGQGNPSPYRTLPIKTGLMTFLNPDESIETFNPSNIPGQQFDSFSKFLVRLIAIGMKTSYELVMQDFTGMSFSSSKTALVDANLENQQWQRFIVTKFAKPAFIHWVAMRMKSGRLPFNREIYNKECLLWQGTEEIGIDPQRDAAANVSNLAAGLDTFEMIYRRRGLDWRKELEQRAIEAEFIEKLAKKYNVKPEYISTVLPPGIVTSDNRAPMVNSPGSSAPAPKG